MNESGNPAKDPRQEAQEVLQVSLSGIGCQLENLFNMIPAAEWFDAGMFVNHDQDKKNDHCPAY